MPVADRHRVMSRIATWSTHPISRSRLLQALAAAFDEGLKREDRPERELVAGTLPRIAGLTSSDEVLQTMRPTPSQWDHVIEGQLVLGTAIAAGTGEELLRLLKLVRSPATNAQLLLPRALIEGLPGPIRLRPRAGVLKCLLAIESVPLPVTVRHVGCVARIPTPDRHAQLFVVVARPSTVPAAM